MQGRMPTSGSPRERIPSGGRGESGFGALLLGFLLFGLLLSGSAACRSGPEPPPTRFEIEDSPRSVRSAFDGEDLVLSFEPQALDRFGVWIEDGAGERIEPSRALGPGGATVDLGTADGQPVASVHFDLERLDQRPWRLRVLPRARVAWDSLLARVERGPVEPACDPFGYEREVWTDPDGRRRVVYARRRPSGERVEVPRRTFERGIAPSIARTCRGLPHTVRTSVAACPRMADFIARGFESGARYMGPTEGDNEHPHARGARFWSRAALAGPGSPHPGAEDPIDTLVWYLVELSNASAADAYRRIWERVLDGSLSEDQYVDLEALQKAGHLRRAVDVLRESAECLGLGAAPAGSGVVFAEYGRWVAASRGDQRALARTILTNPARYTDNPADAGLTYAERLRGLYREHAPIPGTGRGFREHP